MTREEYKTMIDEKLKAVKQELMAEFKEEEPNIDGWKVGEMYFYHDSAGILMTEKISTNLSGEGINIYDIWRINHGHAKRTSEEVQFQIERDAVLYELSKFAEPKDAVWDGTEPHCLITWDFWEGGISVKSICTYKGNDIYFSTEEDAEKAIQAVGEERIKKYYLEVKE